MAQAPRTDLDQMMQVVNPKHWLALATFVVLVMTTLVWAWMGNAMKASDSNASERAQRGMTESR